MHLVISGPPTISHSGPPARAEALGLWLSEPGVPCAALPETAGPAARPATRAHRPPQGPPSSRSTHRRTHARTQPRSPTRLESPPRPSSQAAPQARPHMRTGTCSQTWRQRQKHTAPQPPVLPAGVTHAPGRGPALPPPAAPRGIPTGLPTELPTGLPTRSPTRTAPQAGDRHLQDLPRAGSFPDVPSHLGAPASLSSPSILPVCLVPGRPRGDEGAKCARRCERPACSQHAARPLGPTDSPWCCREQPPGRGAHGTSPEARPALQCPGSTHGLPAGDADLAGAPAFLPVTLPSRPPLQGRVWTNPGKPNWGAGRRGGGQLGGLRGPGLWFLLGFGRGWWGTGPTPSWAWGEQQGTPGWLPSRWRGTQAVALNDGHA